MPCKYGPVFALYLYRIESNHVNTVQNGSVFIWHFSCVWVGYPYYIGRGQVLISRISFKCRLGLTVFYPTKELCFWCYHQLVRVSTIFFWCTSTLYGLILMLKVKPLAMVWGMEDIRYTTEKSFEVWLHWDRSGIIEYSYLYS